ncbi:YheC/YheD family protein [Paenibacillus sp. P26]|nr:YheC/YheD family protein [Paenibacillus sp. P26]UUZ94727.1 YheC/YheD family protein [Paenibacillus sp. P25]
MSTAKNKWLKYRYLKKSRSLGPHMPKTRVMSRRALWSLIRKYGHVMVKPVWGSRGRGIIQVSSLGGRQYALHYENTQTTLKGKSSVYRYIRKRTGSAHYMVQRLIERPTIDGRPFDLRVIIQRKKHSGSWVVTGRVAKVAGKGYVVSNHERSKGQLLTVQTAFRRSTIGHLSPLKLTAEVDKISLKSARKLSKYFPNHRIYGLDIALDGKGYIWIIETNLFPSLSHFRKMTDQSMYRRILSYKKG